MNQNVCKNILMKLKYTTINNMLLKTILFSEGFVIHLLAFLECSLIRYIIGFYVNHCLAEMRCHSLITVLLCHLIKRV